MTTDNTRQIDEFLAQKAQIEAMLERLQQLAADHFDTAPDTLNWTDVAEITRLRSMLQEVHDCAFQEGEYAA